MGEIQQLIEGDKLVSDNGYHKKWQVSSVTLVILSLLLFKKIIITLFSAGTRISLQHSVG